MAKKNIPMGLSGDKDLTDESRYLSELIYKANRTNTGVATYTSKTSSITYSTNNYPEDVNIYNKGEVGLINIFWKLYGGADGFLLLADDINSYIRPNKQATTNYSFESVVISDGNGKNYHPKTNYSSVVSDDKKSTLDKDISNLTESTKNLSTTVQQKANKSKNFSATIRASNWSSSAPYTQTVQVSGMVADGVPLYDLATYSEAQIKEFGKITKLETVAGSIKVTALKEKPTADINLRIEVLY